MLLCSCNVIAKDAFDRAIDRNLSALSETKSILRAVGIVYRDARDTEAGTATIKKPSCTGCFNSVQDLLHDKGLFKDQSIPERILCGGCPRRDQCLDANLA